MDINKLQREISTAIERITAAPDITDTTAAAITAPLYRALAMLVSEAPPDRQSRQKA